MFRVAHPPTVTGVARTKISIDIRLTRLRFRRRLRWWVGRAFLLIRRRGRAGPLTKTNKKPLDPLQQPSRPAILGVVVAAAVVGCNHGHIWQYGQPAGRHFANCRGPWLCSDGLVFSSSKFVRGVTTCDEDRGRGGRTTTRTMRPPCTRPLRQDKEKENTTRGEIKI